MRKMFFEEYSEEMDGVRNLLLQYHIMFEGMKTAAKKDFDDGILTEAEYNAISKYRIDEYHTDKNGNKSPYSLSENQVNMIKKYARLNENGEILLDSLKLEIKDNQAKLYKIFNSIRTFHYYANLGLDEAKAVFTQVVINDYNDKISRLGAALNSGATSLEMNNRTIRNIDIPILMQRLQLQKEEAIGKIEASDLNQLYQLISEFNDVDYSYYEWFRLRTIQEDAKSVEMYEKHENRLAMIKSLQEGIKDKQAKFTTVVRNYSDLQATYQEFLDTPEVVADEREETQKNGGFRKILNKLGLHKRDNRAELAECFISLSSLPGFEDYIATLDKYNETDLFRIYMANNYQYITYVDVDDFRRDLIKNVKTYFIKRLALLKTGISEMTNIIFNEMRQLNENIKIAKEEANYMTQVSSSLKAELRVNGLDAKEQDIIFDDMTLYLKTTYVEEIKQAEEKRKQDELRNSEGDTKHSY